MKKIALTLFSLVFAITLLAQQAPPQGINYQAMVYVPYGNQQVGVNSAGQIPANTKEVVVKFTLEEGNNGPVIYEETMTDTTDQYGLLNAVIGTGTPTSNSPGLFNQIDWSQGDPYLRVSITLTQYNSTVSSYQKLWSVPYALYADQANSANTADYATNSGNADSSDYADVAGNGIIGVTDNGDGTLTFTYFDGSTYTTGILSGLMGQQGPTGLNGSNGQSAYEIWLAEGNTGTQQDFFSSLLGSQGPTGLNGTNGQSAYDLWIAQGNTGTVGDFLNSLVGTNGSQGPQGPQGLQGPAGSSGNGFQNGTTLGQVMYWDGSQWILLNPGSTAQILTICNGVPTWTTGGVCPGTGSITTLNCGGSTNSGTLQSGFSASGVSSSVPYTGGNGGSHNGQSVSSTGVIGLTATLAPGNFANGTGILVYSITGTPTSSGTASFALNIGGQICTLTRTVNLPNGTITTLSCGTASNSGALMPGTVASSVSSAVPYTGGNGGTHNGQTVASTGVIGLTATTAAGTFANGAGTLTYIISGTPNSSGIASFALSIGGQTCSLTFTVSLPIGTISALSCNTSTNTGTLTSGTATSGVSSSVPYTGGNGGTYNGQAVSSTGITGLTATLAAGTFANGAGTIFYTITGTPATSGAASFALNIGGQSCTLTITVSPDLVSQYPAGSVFCAAGPTAIVDVTNPTTGKTWMDRNLGASQVATSSTDNSAYGDLYQWGRRADGHQCRNSNTTTTLSSSAQPANSLFILAPNSPNNWLTYVDNTLWNGVSAVNNPCPIGYRIPTESEYTAEFTSWSSPYADGAFNSPLKFTLAVGRNATTGAIGNGSANSWGSYWNKQIWTNSQARMMVFYVYASSSTPAVVNSMVPAANGRSVRCIKN
jgi:uncharacterized protein (TIGR02145 family)